MEKVSPEEWEEYKRQLKDAYLRMDKLFHENPTWDEDTIGGAMSIVVHTKITSHLLRHLLLVDFGVHIQFFQGLL